jgi:hypothetical protein
VEDVVVVEAARIVAPWWRRCGEARHGHAGIDALTTGGHEGGAKFGLVERFGPAGAPVKVFGARAAVAGRPGRALASATSM